MFVFDIGDVRLVHLGDPTYSWRVGCGEAALWMFSLFPWSGIIPLMPRKQRRSCNNFLPPLSSYALPDDNQNWPIETVKTFLEGENVRKGEPGIDFPEFIARGKRFGCLKGRSDRLLFLKIKRNGFTEIALTCFLLFFILTVAGFCLAGCGKYSSLRRRLKHLLIAKRRKRAGRAGNRNRML